jgi:starch synthase (maltosyl-transferring)
LTTSVYKQTPVIYNLFPRLAGTITDWQKHVDRAVNMHFNWLFINSILYTGLSGSLYSVKEYYELNPDFLPLHNGDGTGLLRQFLHKCLDRGIWPMMDLIINHTSIDCPLTVEHPEWYRHNEHGEITSPYAVDLDNSDKVTVWGDLAEIDNNGPAGKAELWEYWANIVTYYQRLGFKGFRCDAAYKVPADLWRYLTERASSLDPDVLFFAETLGCTEEEMLALRDSGLHFFSNSSKWWDFEQPWCIDQHELFGAIAPSISFPETHDTTRLASDTNGNEAVQRQRYAFAAVFSAGLMMPIGYEFGFRKKTDVVSTRPADWETTGFDITRFIAETNRFKLDHPVFHGEGKIRLTEMDRQITVLERQSDRQPGLKAWILVNKQWDGPVSVDVNRFTSLTAQHLIYYLCRDEAYLSGITPTGTTIDLRPAEVAILTEPQ